MTATGGQQGAPNRKGTLMERMKCCGAPPGGDEATGKYYTRHQRGGAGYQPSPPCPPARLCLNLRSRTAAPADDVVVIDGGDDLVFYDRGAYGLAVARCGAGEEAHWKPHRDQVVWFAHHHTAHTDRPLLRGPANLVAPQTVLHCGCVGRRRPPAATTSSIASYTRRGRGRGRR